MPIDYHIDEEDRRAVATVSGDFTIGDIFIAISSIVHDPKFQPGFSILSDNTAIGTPLTTEQAVLMVEHLKILAPRLAGSRWAVVSSKPTSFGMNRMVSVMTETVPVEMQVFRSMEAADEWLRS